MLNLHPGAVIHPDARLGEGTEVGPFARIESDVVIGERCTIRSHAVIQSFTRMGDQNLVFEGTVIGGLPQDLKFMGGPSYLNIGDRNTFRERVTVHRSGQAGGKTRIGSDNCFQVNAHVAHDCRLGDGIVLGCDVGLAGHIEVEDHAVIESGAVIHQFVHVGRYARIGSKAKVTQDALPFCRVEGVPGRIHGLNLEDLQRAGVTEQTLQTLRIALQLLRRVGPMEQRLAAVGALDSDEARYLADFVLRTTRGLSRFERSRAPEERAV